MRNYPLTVTYLGTKGATVREYIWCSFWNCSSLQAAISSYRLRGRLSSGWESRETRSHKLPTLCITKGPNTGGQVNGHRDTAGAKNSWALGLWVCKSPEIPLFTLLQEATAQADSVLLSINGFIELEIWTFPGGNLGSNHQGNLVWLHESGV